MGLTGWDSLPKGLWNYGHGGFNKFGSLCGAPAACAFIASVIFSDPVTGKLTGTADKVGQALLRWYETYSAPSNEVYLDYRSGLWTPAAGWKAFGSTEGKVPVPLNNAPRAVTNSCLCHAGVTNWRAVAESSGWVAANDGITTADTKKDRCAKVSYDTMYKAVELIQAALDGQDVTPEFATSVGYCTDTCHDYGDPGAKADGKMDCIRCHTQRPGDNHGA